MSTEKPSLERSRVRLLLTTAALLSLPSLGRTQAAASAARASMDGYVIPADLAVKPPPASFGPLPAALSGWWKSVNVPAIFELGLLLVFEEFRSPREVGLVVAIHARRGRPGRTERVTATIDGDEITFVRNGNQRATVKLAANGQLEGYVVVSSSFPAIPAQFARAQP